ncbi:hypothetical protein VST63_23350 [Mycolicibacterium sp. 050232]|uniref:hypothetical protein n=1 Tax=Mycolicibacterium sp. 050232 TaxID=3113982 RepID=UPI002E2E0013|nr:hypothetical protein [Mycolicibacterium sp. 050232]MED5815303.1 hypothetical protein [Mycolicibacterium sp. 050232]
MERNELLIFGKGSTGPEFVQMVIDQYGQLRADSAAGGRVMTTDEIAATEGIDCERQ